MILLPNLKVTLNQLNPFTESALELTGSSISRRDLPFMGVRGKSVDSMISEFVETSILESFDGE